MAKHNADGAWGERQARDYLVKEGFAIFTQDKTLGRSEVDIVAFRGDRVHFVEVKTRGGAWSDPVEGITRDKVRRVCRFADAFVRMHELPHLPQFDVIAVTGTADTGLVSLEYYPDVALPPMSH